MGPPNLDKIPSSPDLLPSGLPDPPKPQDFLNTTDKDRNTNPLKPCCTSNSLRNLERCLLQIQMLLGDQFDRRHPSQAAHTPQDRAL
ncbi:hypothetical protein PtB15_10B446 [Puccinia triticina]|nr:hypothetical protein PtB15_10B446 [Puccinia triticina]